MMITVAIDSETPSCQSFKTMTATTQSTMKTTLLMAYIEIKIFLVAIRRMTHAKIPEIVTP